MKIESKLKVLHVDMVFRKIFITRGQLTLKWMVRSGPKSNTSKIVCCPGHLQVWWRSAIKNERVSLETPFSHCKSMRNLLDSQGTCVQLNLGNDLICSKTLCSLCPTPVMHHIIFDKDWSAGLRDKMGKWCLQASSLIRSSSNLLITRTVIKFWAWSGQSLLIYLLFTGPSVTKMLWKIISPRYWLVLIRSSSSLQVTKDRHKVSDRFDFLPDWTIHFGGTCPWVTKIFPIDLQGVNKNSLVSGVPTDPSN